MERPEDGRPQILPIQPIGASVEEEWDKMLKCKCAKRPRRLKSVNAAKRASIIYCRQVKSTHLDSYKNVFTLSLHVFDKINNRQYAFYSTIKSRTQSLHTHFGGILTLN